MGRHKHEGETEDMSSQPETSGLGDAIRPKRGTDELEAAGQEPGESGSSSGDPLVDESECSEEAEPTESQEEDAQKTEDLKDQLLRALAEIENVRKRASREREDATKYGITGFARDIVGIVDNLRRAMESVDESAGESAEMMKSLQEGIAIIQQEFGTALSRHGVEAIDPIGEPFDHNFHQAMFEVEQDEHPAGTVVQVLQQGYRIHQRLLRPAMVGVAKKRLETDSEAEKEDIVVLFVLNLKTTCFVDLFDIKETLLTISRSSWLLVVVVWGFSFGITFS